MSEMNKFPINKVDSVITFIHPNLPAKNYSQLPHPKFTGEVKLLEFLDLGVDQNLKYKFDLKMPTGMTFLLNNGKN